MRPIFRLTLPLLEAASPRVNAPSCGRGLIWITGGAGLCHYEGLSGKAARMTSTASLSHVWRIVRTALLALAVASAWSSGSMAGTPAHAHPQVQLGHAHVEHAHAEHAHVGHAQVPEAAQTDVSSKGHPAGAAGCVMTTCHPAIVMPAVEIGRIVCNGLPEPAPFLRADGSAPSPALPPPRDSLV